MESLSSGCALDSATHRANTLGSYEPGPNIYHTIEPSTLADPTCVQIPQTPVLEPPSLVPSFILSLQMLSTLMQPSVTLLGSVPSRTLHQEAVAATPANNGDMNDRVKSQGARVVKSMDKTNRKADSKGSRNSGIKSIAISPCESLFGNTSSQSVTPRPPPINMPAPSLGRSRYSPSQPISPLQN